MADLSPLPLLSRNSLHTLPPELTNLILRHLPPIDLSSTAATCTTLRSLSSEDSLWTCHTSAHQPGKAYHSYLVAKAWHRARAHHTFQPLDIAPTLVALTPVSCLIVTDDTPKTNFDNLRVIPQPKLYGPPFLASFIRHPETNALHILYIYSSLAIIQSPTTPTPPLVLRLPSRGPVTCATFDPVTRTVATGSVYGSVVIHPSPRTHNGCVSLSRYSISSIHFHHPHIAIGTSRGEVIVFNPLYPIQRRQYIGPCSCPISSILLSSTHIIAGFSHSISGNGHNSRAIAWLRASGERVGAFGGGGARSSSVFPAASVTAMSGGRGKVALWGGRGVSVYEMKRWKCLIRVKGGERGDMEGERLAISDGGVHVLDFEKAVDAWPGDLESFKPYESAFM